MTRLSTLMLGAGLAAGLGALAPAALAADPCLRTRSIDGFIEATTSSIVMTHGQGRWKADMAGACTDLDKARSLAAVSRGACLKSGDKVDYRDTLGGQRSCRIATLTFQAPGTASSDGAK